MRCTRETQELSYPPKCLAGAAAVHLATVFSNAPSEISITQTGLLLICPIVLGVLVSNFAGPQLDTRRIAALGVLIAADSMIRMLGAGMGGVETVFFLILIAGYLFGSHFGFLTGVGALVVSALLTGGVGAWLPFQALAAGLVGLGAGLLPAVAKRAQRILLAAYSVFAAYLYGFLMTLWNWPYLAGIGTSVSFQPGAGVVANLGRFLNYELLTGGLLWDTGRAITTATLVWLTMKTLSTTLERAARRASIEVRGSESQRES